MSRVWFFISVFWSAHLSADEPSPSVMGPQPCIQFATERAQVTDKKVYLDFVKACEGNQGDACLRFLANRGGLFDKDALLEAAQACRGNVGDGCVQYASMYSGESDPTSLLHFARGCSSEFNN